MNDTKAAAAHHPGDGHVTRPDLDALIAAAQRDINDANRCQTMGIMPATHQLHRRLREVTAALALERARADQAERERDALIWQKRLAPHDPWCPYPANGGYCHPTCWQREPAWPAAAPTAEQ